MQVISTLGKAIDCTHKAAIDYATVVDREVSLGYDYLYTLKSNKFNFII